MASLLLDQRSANDGFLLLLFYFALRVSPGTSSFFAIDNVDASLNPRLCEEFSVTRGECWRARSGVYRCPLRWPYFLPQAPLWRSWRTCARLW